MLLCYAADYRCQMIISEPLLPITLAVMPSPSPLSLRCNVIYMLLRLCYYGYDI